MAQRTITYTHTIDGVLTDVSSVVLRDPTNTYGVKRNDTNGVVVAAGTALTRTAVGTYRYVFTEPANNLTFDYWIERVYLGNTRRTKQTLQGTASGPVGTPTLAPSQYVTMGLKAAACGNDALYTFLQERAAIVWEMQVRRGVTVDLRFMHFRHDLITYAMDHARTLRDTELASQQATDTGYLNASNTGTASATSMRTRTTTATQTASSASSSSRSASRNSSSTMTETANRDSTRVGQGFDTSTTSQTTHSESTQTAHEEHETINIGFGSSNLTRTNTETGIVDGPISGLVEHRSAAIPYIATVSWQNGGHTNDFARQDNSTVSGGGAGDITHTQSVAGASSASGSSSMTGESSRINNISRATESHLTAASSHVQSSTSTSASHNEAHRTGTATAHSEMLGHAESAASATAHRESLGASQMTSGMNLLREYWAQVFESLKVMLEDTVAAIKTLEKEVNLPQRVVIQRLATRTPQAALTVNNVWGNSYVTNSPFGTPFRDTRTVR